MPKQATLEHQFRFINHQKRLIYLNTLFGRKDCIQIIQEDISHYRVTMEKPKQNKFEIQEK